MSRRQRMLISPAELAGMRSSAEAVEATHPQDRVYSGLFGHGRIVEFLTTTDGNAYGHRIEFENGVHAELHIVDYAMRH